MMSKIYCAWEQESFPEDEFDQTADGLVHRREPRHTTLGELEGEQGMPPAMPAPEFEAADD